MSKNDFEPLDEDIQWFDEPDTPAWARGDGSCTTKTPEPHERGEFPMTCYDCHVWADS